MQIYNTADALSKYENILLYGLAGAGKTPMAASMPDVIIISSEPGLKSLQRYKLPYIVAADKKQAWDAHKWVTGSNEAKKHQSVFFDSISALSESICEEEKAKSRDPRKFSPATTAETMALVLAYQRINNKHVCMTAKATVTNVTAADGITQRQWIEPFCVVPKLGPMLPYHFDSVLYISRHAATTTQSEYAMLTCRSNDMCLARNRGDMLALYEPADLGYIINKSNGVV